MITLLTPIWAWLQYKCVFFLDEVELSCYMARRERVVACDHHHLKSEGDALFILKLFYLDTCAQVRQLIYMMRRFLDLSDDSLAVTLEGAGHNHESSKMQVTLQNITAHLTDLCEPKISTSVSNVIHFCMTTWTQTISDS